MLNAHPTLANIFEGAKGFKSDQGKDGKKTKHDHTSSCFFRMTTIMNDLAEKYPSNQLHPTLN